MLAHTLEADTRSHQKKATLTKMKGTLLLKWLTALCVLECVGAKGVPGPAGAADPDSPWAPTHSSTQRAASHLSGRAPFILVSLAFFWCERVSCSSEP